MLDGKRTTVDWQVSPTTTCILPVGSFEQHGPHLPLATDTILAEQYATWLAEDIGGAVLPTLSIGTCLEHSGFRGSVTLKPETLMQIMRDLADDLERQHFRVLVIVNGHGGNWALAPVVRDINRMDRQLKILFGEPYLFWPPTAAGEIHAGVDETAVMLALRPDLVKGLPGGNSSDDGKVPLAQRDLNHFGSGYFSPSGFIGKPEDATAEMGRAIIAESRLKFAEYVRDRIDRWRRQPRYAGGGGIQLREMNADDIADGMRLKALAGWNQLEADWQIFLRSRPQACFVAVHNGGVVGTVATIEHGKYCAWIGMVLVDPTFRRLGIGTQLLEGALKSLEKCASVKLDATPAGKEVYDKLGFVDERRLTRLVCTAVPAMEGLAETLSPDKLGETLAWDQKIFAADRGNVLKALASQKESSWQLKDRAYCFSRRGANFTQVGPIVAKTTADAKEVTSAALATLTGKPVVIDVPDAQAEYIEWLRSLGFSAQRPFIRMCKGKKLVGEVSQEFAITGPEFG